MFKSVFTPKQNNGFIRNPLQNTAKSVSIYVYSSILKIAYMTVGLCVEFEVTQYLKSNVSPCGIWDKG